MKNKKGFTLVEIIAALVILGILLIIALPAVTNSIMESRDSSYVTTIKKFIEAVRNEVTAHEYIISNTDTTYYIPTQCLNVENKEESPYGKMQQSYVVVVIGEDGRYSYYYLGRDDTNHGMNLTSSDDITTDNLKKNINTISTNQKVGNREKIAVYSNDCDKTISVIYGSTTEATCGKVTGESTTWTTSDRTIVVKCEGSCKQATYRKTFDKTTKVGIIEIESTNGTKVKCRVNVYVDKGDQAAKIVATKRITNREVEDGTVSNEGLHFTINRTSNGPSGGSIYYCKDTIDECEPQATIQDGRKITKFEEVEGIYYIRYKVIGGNGTESDTYSYQAKVDTKRPTITVAAKKKTAGTEVSPGTWSNEGLNYHFNITKNGIAETVVYYCSDTTDSCEPTDIFDGRTDLDVYNNKVGIYYIRFRAVKEETNRNSEVSSYLAKVDVEPPTCSISINPTGWATSATLIVSGSDTGGSELAAEPYSWTSATSGYGTITTKSINTNGTYSAWMKDVAGNVGTCSKVVTTMDTVVPTVTIVAKKKTSNTEVATDTWSTEGLNFILTQGTVGASGATIKYCKDIDNSCTPNTTTTSGATITSYNATEGTFYIRYQIIGGSGLSSTVASFKAKVDTVAPTVSITAKKKTAGTEVASNVWSTEGLNFKIDSTSTGEAVALTYYCKDTVGSCTPSTPIASGTNLTDYNTIEGIYYIRTKTVKESGLSSEILSHIAKVDTKTPTVTITATKKTAGTTVASNTWSVEGLDFKFTQGNVGSSGATIKYCKDTANSCNPSNVATSGTAITAYNGLTGTYYIRYKIVGGNGLSSTVASYTAKVDTTTPSVTITATKKTSGTTVSSGTTSNEGLNFTLTNGTVGSSGATIYYCKDTANSCNPSNVATSGTAITSYNGLTGTYYIRYKIVGGNGLSSTVASYTAVVSTTCPAGEFMYNGSCTSCPPGYTSNAGATAITQCYYEPCNGNDTILWDDVYYCYTTKNYNGPGWIVYSSGFGTNIYTFLDYYIVPYTGTRANAIAQYFSKYGSIGSGFASVFPRKECTAEMAAMPELQENGIGRNWPKYYPFHDCGYKVIDNVAVGTAFRWVEADLYQCTQHDEYQEQGFSIHYAMCTNLENSCPPGYAQSELPGYTNYCILKWECYLGGTISNGKCYYTE